MNSFIITTDSTVDMPLEYLKEYQNTVLSLSYELEGESYIDMYGLTSTEFYDKVRNGAMPVTSQVNPEQALEAFGRLLEAGNDILHIGFSSGLSGSYNSACIAAEELLGIYKERKIIVIDSLCASMGEGLLLYKANLLKKEGKTIEETASWVEDHKLHICHDFTVDDLNHLHRGGRISKATAVVGSVINIKPILYVDESGQLVPVGKVRGRKKSLIELAERMAYQRKEYTNDIVMISHGDCPEDAEFLRRYITEQLDGVEVMIHPIGSVIGTHSGPGTVALFYMGDRMK